MCYHVPKVPCPSLRLTHLPTGAGAFLELLQQEPGGSCAGGFCRLGGRTLGIVAGPPGLFCEAALDGLERAQVPILAASGVCWTLRVRCQQVTAAGRI